MITGNYYLWLRGNIAWKRQRKIKLKQLTVVGKTRDPKEIKL